uniref:BED-type domain-containing protein n=1 Tax=Gongylonema pulchrum TaxID=637853 RepID=A0A183EV27_9BILA
LTRAKSKVWLFCERIDEDGESKAKCKICGMVMLRKLGSTRAMLRHLRKMHENLIDGIIRPITKRIQAIAGKPRDNNGFDVDDDGAWVEEVDQPGYDCGTTQHRYVTTASQQQQRLAAAYKSQNLTRFAQPEQQPEQYHGDYYLEEASSYGSDFVDVLYVGDQNSYEEVIPKH